MARVPVDEDAADVEHDGVDSGVGVTCPDVTGRDLVRVAQGRVLRAVLCSAESSPPLGDTLLRDGQSVPPFPGSRPLPIRGPAARSPVECHLGRPHGRLHGRLHGRDWEVPS